MTSTGTSGIPLRPLGTTGVSVSMLCLGGFHLSVPAEDEATRIIHTAIDHGITGSEGSAILDRRGAGYRDVVANAHGAAIAEPGLERPTRADALPSRRHVPSPLTTCPVAPSSGHRYRTLTVSAKNRASPSPRETKERQES